MQSSELIRKRAAFLASIRAFFAGRNCIEVDTPLLRNWTVTDPYMRALSAVNPDGRAAGFLQTSPEYAMKKLLANARTDIYQLGKVFRADEQGILHRNEFCLLEWYRLGLDHWQLMAECEALLGKLLGHRPVRYLSWQEASVCATQQDLSRLSLPELRKFAIDQLGDLPQDLLRDNYLTLLFDQLIEPTFGADEITFVYAFPASQASLAKLGRLPEDQPKVSTRARALAGGELMAERFEIFCNGLELANGFHELTDATEQQQRFEEDNRIRTELGYEPQQIDPELMDALGAGLPACAGVAMGVDRLFMLACEASEISEVTF